MELRGLTKGISTKLNGMHGLVQGYNDKENVYTVGLLLLLLLLLLFDRTLRPPLYHPSRKPCLRDAPCRIPAPRAPTSSCAAPLLRSSALCPTVDLSAAQVELDTDPGLELDSGLVVELRAKYVNRVRSYSCTHSPHGTRTVSATWLRPDGDCDDSAAACAPAISSCE